MSTVQQFFAATNIGAFLVVKQGNGNTVSLATSPTDKIIGLNSAAAVLSGAAAQIGLSGLAKAVAGAAVAAGDLLTVDGSGRVITADPSTQPNYRTVGVALSAAAAVGDVIQVLIDLGVEGALGPTGPSGAITGEVKIIAYAAADAGYLLCDGTSYLRATYAALFDKIGTAYGSADGTHFNVPDLVSRAPFGAGAVLSIGDSDGIAVGSRTGPNHPHSLDGVTGQLDSGNTIIGQGLGDFNENITLNPGQFTGAGAPNYLGINFQIKT